ncbi:HECT domain protein [Talaromyces proteolyticus]|uniref:HECT-type E3 ubiquitin transferase n=1 Tax=Talaromyces proteolyticus TaxID=1131652 RepID=A0AAD4Q0Z9_9EURO|nr:HECT domain protein [Talaromyces proteolyticus]KAH8705070.1 HECT domain protein [Talaromyces proteolyticus]
MTRMRGGSLGSGDTAVGRQLPCLSKLPPNSPEVIVKNTISVNDPASILVQHRDDRRRQFNSLVRRYKHQILYGCENPECRTPTCLSYQKKATDGPFRQYTDLSARTLACYLASQDNADRGLCRNPPRPPSDFPPVHSSHRHRHHRDNTIDAQPIANPPGGEIHPSSLQSQTSADASSETLCELTERSTQGSLFSNSSRAKDPKSFTQNLFDTLSLRMVEWLPLRQSTAENHLCASPTLHGRRKVPLSFSANETGYKHTSNDHGGKQRTHAHSISNTTISEVQASTNRQRRPQHSALEVRVSGQPVKRVSLEQVEPWLQTPRATSENKPKVSRIPSSKSTPSKGLSQQPFFPPPALKHRSKKSNQTIHNSQKKSSNPRRVSWDGSKFPKELSHTRENSDEMVKLEETSEDLSPYVTPPHFRQNDDSTSDSTSTVQTVSHLSTDIVDGLYKLLADNEDDAQRWKEEVDNMNIQGRSDNYQWRFASVRQREVYPFVAQSIYYGLSSSQQLLQSFRGNLPPLHEGHDTTEPTTIDLHALESTLRKLHEICPWELILNSLWSSLERLFIPPKNLPLMLRNSRRMSQYMTGNRSPISSRPTPPISEEPLSDIDAAHMLTVVFFVLITFLPKVDSQTWRGIQEVREAGIVLPSAQLQKLPLHNSEVLLDTTDKLENDLALRLVRRLVRALAARLAFYEISKTRSIPASDIKQKRPPSVLELLFNNLCGQYETLQKVAEQNIQPSVIESPIRASVMVEWLRTLFLKEWDGKPEILRSGTAGGAVQILSSLYKDRRRLGLEAEDFHTAFLSERLDPMEMPVEWLGRTASNNKKLHLLSFTFLFPPAALVKYFRAINYTAMSKAYEAGMIAQRQASQTAFNRTIQIADEISLLARLHTSMTQYFIISVRRNHAIVDAFNQIWRRERRELMRPLKVKMGMDLGEEGVDLGGVQQEFMTLVFAEALDPDHGLFTVDTRTHMAWFQPCSLEGLEHFELIGILMSLAIYNGLTLPITLPTAFYRKLLGLKVKHIDHIRDGWPDLAKGLESLLSWSDGDVSDIFMRSYEFSFEAFGSVKAVDMKQIGRDANWPLAPLSRERTRSNASEYSTTPKTEYSKGNINVPQGKNDSESFQNGILKGAAYATPLPTPSYQQTDEPILVTNENREQYVKDYIFWLTDKSIRPQFEAFSRGFFTCLDRLSLSIFTPEALRTLVEGIQEYNMDELQRYATYDGGWDADHPLIMAFWDIVKLYSREQKARLLEFVTASDRIPVNGISSINFVIQRNGSGDDRLPTSYTCYGRLLLPEYTGSKALEENLDMALKNSRGFGNF